MCIGTKKINKIKDRVILTVFIFFVTIASGYGSVSLNKGTAIYFFNPEASINNFSALKTAIDAYLSRKGNYYFQPFAKRDLFESITRNNKEGIYLLSSWHLKLLKKQNIPFEVKLVATSKGNTMQRKVLSAKKDISNITMLKNAVVAGAGSEEYIHSVLKQILGKEHESLLKDIKILIVPKDIDAIMTVGFGMAAAAVSSENCFHNLMTINPNQFRELHSLGFSEKDYLLVAATLKRPGQEETKLLDVLRKMPETGDGEDKLKFLGVDGWIPL